MTTSSFNRKTNKGKHRNLEKRLRDYENIKDKSAFHRPGSNNK